MSASSPLRGCTVFVDVQNEHGLNATPLFSKRLAGLGASVVERLSKAVTHVVFKGHPDQLRSLHERLAKLSPASPPHLVSVTWVAACVAAGARVAEAAHAQSRPPDTLASLLSSPPYVRGGSGAKRRKSWAPQPAEKFDFDLDDPAFSSSQKAACGAAAAAGCAAPAPAPPPRSLLGPPANAPGSAPPALATRAGSARRAPLPPRCAALSPLRPAAALRAALRLAAGARTAEEQLVAAEEAAAQPEPAAAEAATALTPARSPLAPVPPNPPEPEPASEPEPAAQAAAAAKPALPPPPPPPARRGVLAITCGSPDLHAAAAAAASALRAGGVLRLCPFASAAATHLVLGEPQRTLKVMHAIARGAWLLRPEWLYRSVEAGGWLPEEPFEDATFAGARRARIARGAPGGLLKGMRVAVMEPRRAAPPAADLRLLVTAAGGVVVKKGNAAVLLCAAGDGAAARAAAAAVKAAPVTEQWLFAAITAYELPAITAFAPA